MAKKTSTKKTPAKKKRPVCGDYGGKRRDGKPCGVLVGKGRCRHHTEDANSRRQRLKTSVLRMFQKGTYSLAAVCSEKGIDPSTLWGWRRDDPIFDKAFVDAQEKSDRIRVKLVEDSLFKRILAGDASAAELIFFLTNRSKKRWKHRYALEHTGPDDGPIVTEKIDPSKLSDEDIHLLKELAQKVARDTEADS